MITSSEKQTHQQVRKQTLKNHSQHKRRHHMLDLIDELSAEHSDLSISFGNLERLDITSEESHKEFQSIKSSLLAHLRKENEELYPQLREISFNNLQLQRTLDWFMRDLARISAVLILFLDTYADGGSPLAFRRDFKRLNKILNALIKQEERIIYTEYQNASIGKVA